MSEAPRTRRRLRCLLGFQRRVTNVSEGQRFLRCRDCGKYGGSPPAPWKFGDRSYGTVREAR